MAKVKDFLAHAAELEIVAKARNIRTRAVLVDMVLVLLMLISAGISIIDPYDLPIHITGQAIHVSRDILPFPDYFL